jgi:hypothetical protein
MQPRRNSVLWFSIHAKNRSKFFCSVNWVTREALTCAILACLVSSPEGLGSKT